MYVIGIDGGGTKTRLAVCAPDGTLLRRETLGAFNLSAIGEDGFRRRTEEILALCGDMRGCGAICVGGAGVSGAAAGEILRAELAALDLLIVPWEDARDGSVCACVESVAQLSAPRIGVLIGPEGGISPAEAQWLREEAGGRLVTLGPRILRTETAGLCALTMVMADRGEME